MMDAAPHVLVIEDDLDTQANLRDILELDEYEVTSATTAAEVLRRQDWASVAVVILDRRLPDGTAEELLPRLKHLAPDAAVIVVTGFADVEGAIAALRRGASDYILKPINADALRASLSRIIETKQARDELRARNEQQAVVAELGVIALKSTSLTELIDTVVARAARTLQVECAKLLELLPDGSGLLVRSGVGWQTGVVGRRIVAADHTTQAGRALQSGVPILVEDLTHEERFPGSSLLHEHGIVCGISVVVYGGRRPFGVLGAHATRRRTFTKSDVDFLQSIANVLAAALERQQAEERVRQSDRLAAIGQMVTGLAHESRNALQRSQACLEMLALELEGNAAALDLIARIQSAQDHLHHLYEEVRSYAAPIRLRRVACDLRALWCDTWTHLHVFRGKKVVRLSEQGESEILVCEADPHAIEQVFRNILENAIAACPEPGEVVVRYADTEIDGVPAVRLSFTDNGPGLTAEQRARIFEPFFTTKTQGTGLGMAIAKRIVEAHGGRIAVGAPSHGAELIVLLPRSAS